MVMTKNHVIEILQNEIQRDNEFKKIIDSSLSGDNSFESVSNLNSIFTEIFDDNIEAMKKAISELKNKSTKN